MTDPITRLEREKWMLVEALEALVSGVREATYETETHYEKDVADCHPLPERLERAEAAIAKARGQV